MRTVLIIVVIASVIIAGFSVAIYGFGVDNGVTRAFAKIFPMPAAMVNRNLIFLGEVEGGDLDKLIREEMVASELAKRKISAPSAMREQALQVAVLKEDQTSPAYNKIREAKSKLGSGMDFTAAAKTYSEDEQSRYIGGDLGFRSKDEVDPWLVQTVSGLEVGEISDIVITPAGYHILKVASRDTEGRVQLRHILTKGRDLGDYLDEAKDNYRVYVFDKNLLE